MVGQGIPMGLGVIMQLARISNNTIALWIFVVSSICISEMQHCIPVAIII